MTDQQDAADDLRQSVLDMTEKLAETPTFEIIDPVYPILINRVSDSHQVHEVPTTDDIYAKWVEASKTAVEARRKAVEEIAEKLREAGLQIQMEDGPIEINLVDGVDHDHFALYRIQQRYKFSVIPPEDTIKIITTA